MFLILILCSLFLGIVSLVYEKKNFAYNKHVLIAHARLLSQHSSDEKAYMQQLRLFLESNSFTLECRSEGLFATRKIFSPGLFLLGFGLIIVGALLYIVYYKFYARPCQIPLPSFHFQKDKV